MQWNRPVTTRQNVMDVELLRIASFRFPKFKGIALRVGQVSESAVWINFLVDLNCDPGCT